MRLKAPPGTTLAQSPSAVYPIDAEGCIDVPDGHLDTLLFQEFGFQPVAGNPLALPTRPAPEAMPQAPEEGDPA